MRLIDADLLKQNCKCTGEFEDNFKGVDLITLANVIDAQPTAYDVDEVVAELESEYDNIPFQYENNYEDGFSDGLLKAIDIVRKGGVK